MSPTGYDARTRAIEFARAYSKEHGPDRLASHWTASQMWSLATLGRNHGTFAFTENHQRIETLKRSGVTLFRQPLGPEAISRVEGVPCTSLARTVVDCSLGRRLASAVVAMESALFHLPPFDEPRLRKEDLAAELEACKFRRGVEVARVAMDFAGTRSQSPLESRIRLVLHYAGVEPPVQQLVFRNGAGDILYIADMGWPEQRQILECDGSIKYNSKLGGVLPAERVAHDHRRDRHLRELGWQTIRATWKDVERPDSLLGLLAEGGVPLRSDDVRRHTA